MKKKYQLVKIRTANSETLTQEFGDWDVAAYGEDYILFQKQTVFSEIEDMLIKGKLEDCMEAAEKIPYLPNIKTPNICHCGQCNPTTDEYKNTNFTFDEIFRNTLIDLRSSIDISPKDKVTIEKLYGMLTGTTSEIKIGSHGDKKQSEK